MQLDPQAAAFLDTLKDADAKPFSDITLAEARVAAQVFADLAGAPEATHDVEHIFISGPTADLPTRIYRPLGAADAQAPALVYFHGSGWIVSNIGITDTLCRSLANRTGCVIVSVNYQKAPEHKFPIPLDDCYAATCWVADHAATLGLDANRIGVIGDSAGGNLAAAVTLRARDENGPAIAYQVLVYPATQYGWDTPSYHRNAEGFLIGRADMKVFWNHYVRDAGDGQHPWCSPLAARDHSRLPPALIITAGFDPLCDDGRMYAEKLTAAGVPVTYRLYEGMIHGFFAMSGILDQSKFLLDEIGREVRAALLP